MPPFKGFDISAKKLVDDFKLFEYVPVMTRKSQLSTVDDVIDAFGGTKAMCELFGGGPSRFSNYKAAGKFPDRMHMRIYRAACKRGLNIADKLLGAEEPEPQRELPLMAAE